MVNNEGYNRPFEELSDSQISIELLYIILNTILRLISSLLIIISFGSIQKLLRRYFFPVHNCIE